MSDELFRYSVQTRSPRDGPASSNRDIVVGKQNALVRALLRLENRFGHNIV